MTEPVGLELDELLHQVRQCIIAGAREEQWLSLQILTPSTRELRAFRVSVQPNGRLLSVLTHPLPQQTQPPTEEQEQQSTQSPSHPDADPITVATSLHLSQSAQTTASEGQHVLPPYTGAAAAVLPTSSDIADRVSSCAGLA
jgi:hypothetical protein